MSERRRSAIAGMRAAADRVRARHASRPSTARSCCGPARTDARERAGERLIEKRGGRARATSPSPATSTRCARRRSSSRRSPRTPDAKAALLARLGRAARRTTRSSPRPRPRCRSSELAAASGRPDRFVGAARLQPGARRWTLVELVFPAAADRGDAASARARCAPRSARPRSRCPTSPGFVVNRLLFPFLFDAVRAARARPASRREAIDDCMTAGRRPPDGAARAARLRRARRGGRDRPTRSTSRSPRASQRSSPRARSARRPAAASTTY